MSAVILALGFADGSPCPHAGQYIESFDHEAFDGQGVGVFTPDLDRAKRFADTVEALRFWQRVPQCRRYREDGEPNRPLTALTAEIVSLDT